MDPMPEQPEPGTCDLPSDGWYCSLDAGHDGPCPTWPEPEPAKDHDPDRAVRNIVIVAVSILGAIGMTSAILGVVGYIGDRADDRTNAISACRSELRVKYVDVPGAKVGRYESILKQINAAGLEGVVSEDGRSVTTPDPDPSPYDGLTQTQLRPLSGAARLELHHAEQGADRDLDTFDRLTSLAKNDTDKFLTECERLTS